MAFKVFIAASLLAVVAAQYAPAPKYAPPPPAYAPAPAPAYAPKPYAPKPYAPKPYAPKYPEPEPAYPKYAFEYAVNEPSTYDIKSQKEERDGDYVKGVYELYEPDGTQRIVEYSDDGYGFQATVNRIPGKAPAYAPKPYAPAPAYPVPAPAYPAPAPAYPKPAYPAPYKKY